MWSIRKTADGKKTGYGLGWSISNEKKGLEIGHGGGQAGTTCMLVIRPEKNIVVAVMSNLRGAREVKKLARRIADIAAE
jgi:CubicO group peptidase (beta-lactamase class C family)